MRILFIKPYHQIHVNQNIEIPLGPMALSAWLKQRFGDSVRVSLFDMRLDRRPAALSDTIRMENPDVIGISMLAFERTFLEHRYDVLRAAAPDVPIFLGGPLPTSDPDTILNRFPDVAGVVRGEGEITFEKIVDHLMRGANYHDEPGLSYHNGTGVVHNADRPMIRDINDLPMPDYDLISISDYHGYHAPMNVILKEHRYIQIVTSRSCPYNCVYCHNIFGKGFRPLRADRVFGEISFLYREHDIREFQIIDDIFNLDRDRMHDILHRIIESDMQISLSFPNAVRGDLLNRADIDLLHDAGCYNLTLSVETATPRIQRLIRKNLNIGKTMDNLRYAHSRGILTRAYFMVGFPGETEREVQRTLHRALDPALDMMSIFKVVPFPGTRLHDMVQDEYGTAPSDVYRDFFTSRSYYEEITGVPLKKMIRNTYFRFYLPFRICRTFFRLPRKLHFLIRLMRNTAMILARDRTS